MWSVKKTGTNEVSMPHDKKPEIMTHEKNSPYHIIKRQPMGKTRHKCKTWRQQAAACLSALRGTGKRNTLLVKKRASKDNIGKHILQRRPRNKQASSSQSAD